jgi:hypothetical protein
LLRAASPATPSRAHAFTPTSKRPETSCSNNARRSVRIGHPKRHGRSPSPREGSRTAFQSAAGRRGAVRKLLCARVRGESPDGDGDLALHGAEEMLRGPRLISPPFLRRNEAHARAEAFVVARGLAGILERRVVAGPVSARTHLSCKLRRISRWAAAYAGRWFCVLQILAVHSSSLFVSPWPSFGPGSRSS